MTNEQRPEENYVLSWSDLGVVFKRCKKKIVYISLFFAFLASLYTLSRDVTYMAQGTFREKNKQANSNEKTLSALLMSGGTTAAESMAISTIKSRRVLEKVVENLGLQATITKKNDKNFVAEKVTYYLSNIYNNLVVQEAYLSKKYKPVVKDPVQDLVAKDVIYNGETGVAYELRFTDDDSFAIYNVEDKFVGRGSLGKPIRLENLSFFVYKRAEDAPLLEKTYIISVGPLPRIAQNVLSNLVVEADKLDKTLLKINYHDTDRHSSSRFLNTLMSAYRSFLVDEHVRVTADQVAYLKERQEDMDRQLMTLMEDHAVNIASNDASIELLVKTQQNYKTKLLNIDLEAKLLEKAQQEGIAFFERHSADGESPVVQNLLGDIRRYRQQADTLELAMKNSHVSSFELLKTTFDHHVEELDETVQASKDARLLLAEVEKGNLVSPPDALTTNAKYLVRPWYEKLVAADNARQAAVTDEDKAAKEEDFSCSQAHFAAYLTNLLHLFEVQKKAVQDRLTHQQNAQPEFQGIDLETANGLYISYSRELHSLEADLAQKEFIIQQLSQPDFEVSSINSIMDDTISREIVGKTSALMLTLKDEPNRTTKESERLKRDIEVQKKFLIVHLKQMCDITRLREQLLEDKIHSLQSVTLELIRQKVSIQEKHLVDFIHSRLNNLKHERFVISQHQEELQEQLDQLPEKWASQKLIDQHLQSNLSIVHQIASMIESKTIAENLEVSQSAPFDSAVTPVLPRDPRILLFASIGGVGGLFLSFCFYLIQSAVRGVQVTRENLQAIHQNVAGHLSFGACSTHIDEFSYEDLETLRRLVFQLCPDLGAHSSMRQIALIEGHGPHYADALATLVAKRGMSVLVLPLIFDGKPLAEQQPSLLDVLEGRATEPKVIKGLYFDSVAAGGTTVFANELLKSEAFEKLLVRLSADYDVIIGYTDASPTSAEAEGLLALFPRVAVTLSDEKLADLGIYFEASREENKKVSFIV